MSTTLSLPSIGLGLLFTISMQGGQYSYTADFIRWPNPSNNSTNVWQYFYGIQMLNRTGSYARFSLYDDSIANTGTEGWVVSADFPPCVGIHAREDDVFKHFKTGEGHVYPASDGSGVAIGFRAPTNGTYDLQGYVRAAGNGSINWYLDRGNGSNVLAFGTQVCCRCNQNFYVPHLDLAAGELVYLIVDNDGDWRSDSTAVEFIARPSEVLMNLGVYVGVTVYGEPGHTYRLEYLDELAPVHTWNPLATVMLSGPSKFIPDLTSPAPATRYYRVIEVR